MNEQQITEKLEEIIHGCLDQLIRQPKADLNPSALAKIAHLCVKISKELEKPPERDDLDEILAEIGQNAWPKGEKKDEKN